jgi:hypothetical protein
MTKAALIQTLATALRETPAPHDMAVRLAAEALTERLFATGFMVMRRREGKPHST